MNYMREKVGKAMQGLWAINRRMINKSVLSQSM